MKTEKEAAVSRKTDEMKTSMVASIEFAARAPLREEYVDADFVHSILGRVLAKSEDPGDEEDAGYIKASVVQFGEGMDHGIGTDRLGDGIEGNIAEYWELLFDLETGYWREEIQDEYEASACDLLIIDCVEIRPKWRGMGVGPAIIDRKRSRLPPQPGSGHSQGSVGLSTEELGGTSCTVAVSSRRAVAAIERDTQCPAGEAPVSQQTWESQQRERHDREAGLDLLDFPTIIFYESGYSLHTLRQASRRSWRIGQRRPVRVKFLCSEGTMQTSCLRLMGKKLLVALTMEGKFAGEGLQSIDEDDDMLSAMARELVERNGIGDTADSVWRALSTEHQKLFPGRSHDDDDASTQMPGILLDTQSDPAGLVEGAMDTASIVVFGQRPGSLAKKRRTKPVVPEQASLFSLS